MTNWVLQFLLTERIAQNHSSSLFSFCSSTEVISSNFSPSMHTQTHAWHTCMCSLSPSLYLSVSVSVFLSLCIAHSCFCMNTLSHILTHVNQLSSILLPATLFLSLSWWNTEGNVHVSLLAALLKACPFFSFSSFCVSFSPNPASW